MTPPQRAALEFLADKASFASAGKSMSPSALSVCLQRGWVERHQLEVQHRSFIEPIRIWAITKAGRAVLKQEMDR